MDNSRTDAKKYRHLRASSWSLGHTILLEVEQLREDSVVPSNNANEIFLAGAGKIVVA
ncbi:MAG TPA: hypothetical protein VK603_14800 [Candidatus Saccharimonadales bacterium]|nr:hypothetical protein [Candidatus Saccharimonadales bacterium]